MLGKRNRRLRCDTVRAQPTAGKRSLERRCKIKNRIGNGAAGGNIEPIRPLHPYRLRVSRRRCALVGEHQNGGAARSDDQPRPRNRFERRQRRLIGKFGRQHGKPTAFTRNADHPAAPQRIDGGFGMVCGVCHRLKVAICGT